MHVIFLVWIFSSLPVWKDWISCFGTITTFWRWKAASAAKNTDNFLPPETLDPVILIYIYIAPLIPEDPNALYKLTLSVNRSCTNIHGYINRGSNPITHCWNASLCLYSQHSWQVSSAYPTPSRHPGVWCRHMPLPCWGSTRNLGKQQKGFTAWATHISLLHRLKQGKDWFGCCFCTTSACRSPGLLLPSTDGWPSISLFYKTEKDMRAS